MAQKPKMVDEKLIMSQEKHLIYIERSVSKEKIRFDLKTSQMERIGESGNWESVKTQYRFFQGFTLADIKSKDEKFKKLFEMVKQINKECISVSTFITKFPEVAIYEGYISEGIDFEFSASWNSWNQEYDIYGVKKPIHEQPKSLIQFVKKHNVRLTESIEKLANEKIDFVTQFCGAVSSAELRTEDISDAFGLLTSYGGSFERLVNRYNYDMKSLLRYLFFYLKPFENQSPYNACENLVDYYEMGTKMSRKLKKYPKYLRSMHDIISANWDAFEKTYNEKHFKATIRPELEYKDEHFIMVNPKNPKDIIGEGTALNHCVSSYVDKIINGESYIIFLRGKKTSEESLITVEIIGKAITQAKGSYNRALVDKERTFLEKYAKKMKLKVEVY